VHVMQHVSRREVDTRYLLLVSPRSERHCHTSELRVRRWFSTPYVPGRGHARQSGNEFGAPDVIGDWNIAPDRWRNQSVIEKSIGMQNSSLVDAVGLIPMHHVAMPCA
jgi:hypothetical protein